MLTLERNTWYGWQMLPGYLGRHCLPYFSPILVHEVSPQKTGKGVLRLAFANALYAQGVQDFVVDLRVTSRATNYLVGELVASGSGGELRCAIISKLELEWLWRFCPELVAARPIEACSPMAKSSVAAYLNEVFGVRAL